MKFIVFVFSFFLWIVPLCAKDPEIFYLTWAQDPSATMVVEWHSKEKESAALYFQQEGGKWFQQEALRTPLADSRIFVNSVQLVNLEPDTRYFIQFEKKGERYYFRTLPKDFSRPIRFVVGGDLFLDFRSFKRMNRQVLATSPDFIVLGGDLAYAQNPKTFVETKGGVIKQWESFFRNLKTALVTTDKRIIPILPVVGNHDITKFETKPLFVQFFPHYKNYQFLQLTPNLSLFLLDTGHLVPIQGEQTKWLEAQLKEQERVKFKIPLYHIAAYPSHYPFGHRRALQVREHWVPLFEKYQVKFAFEHHNHAFKRTYPIKENQIDPKGVIYLGDGAWGVPPREVQTQWYLEKAAKLNCFWLAVVNQDDCHLQSFDLQGNLIDEVTIK